MSKYKVGDFVREAYNKNIIIGVVTKTNANKITMIPLLTETDFMLCEEKYDINKIKNIDLNRKDVQKFIYLNSNYVIDYPFYNIFHFSFVDLALFERSHHIVGISTYINLCYNKVQQIDMLGVDRVIEWMKLMGFEVYKK